MEKSTTNRGFEYIEFTDDYGQKCSIQESSSVTPRIWIGVNDANPRVMASDAEKLGIETDQTTGWIPFPIPDQVLLTTRMHLSKQGLRQLIDQLEDCYQRMPVLVDEEE